MRTLIAVAIGLASGVASGAFGIGGALLTTPGIRLLLGTPALVAVGTTLPVIVPAAMTGLVAYVKGGHVDVRAAAVSAVAGSAFSVVGAYTSDAVPGEALLLVTAALMLVLAIRMAPRSFGGRPPRIRPSTAVYAITGAVSGYVSGLLGVGGGVILVPVYVSMLRLPVKTALGTSLAVVAAQAVPGSVIHTLLGHIDWPIAAGLAAGVIPGARIGSRLAVAAQDATLRTVVAAGMAALAVAFGAQEFRALVR